MSAERTPREQLKHALVALSKARKERNDLDDRRRDAPRAERKVLRQQYIEAALKIPEKVLAVETARKKYRAYNGFLPKNVKASWWST